MIKDTTICDERTDINRTKIITDSLMAACRQFDLAVPIWLDKNILEFKAKAKTRFYSDNFIETIDFDYMEFHVIEDINGELYK